MSEKGLFWAHLACAGMPPVPPKPGDRGARPGNGAAAAGESRSVPTCAGDAGCVELRVSNAATLARLLDRDSILREYEDPRPKVRVVSCALLRVLLRA